MIDAGTYNACNWVDLSTPDVDSALRFYGELLGWSYEATTTPMGEYHLATVDGHHVGGIMGPAPDQPPTPAMWTVFCYVESTDETTIAADGAGGEILEPPFDIPGDSRVAVVADPTGAMLGVISGPRPVGSYFSRLPGAVCWVELATHDTQGAEGFYAAVFGWKAVTEPTGELPYTVFRLDGQEVAGMMVAPAEAPAHWGVYFATANCTVTEQRAAKLGGRVLRPTTSVEIGALAVIADPQGATFHVLEFGDG